MSRHSTLSTKPKPRRAYSEGRFAAVVGLSIRQNPYKRNQAEWHMWREGHTQYKNNWIRRSSNMRS